MAADSFGWVIADGFQWLRMVSGGFRWFRMVSGSFGWFPVLVVTTSASSFLIFIAELGVKYKFCLFQRFFRRIFTDQMSTIIFQRSPI